MTLTGRDVSALLERHGVTPSRALGQNFVVDPNTVRRIVRLAEIPPDVGVLEIGAGVGSLTIALCEQGHAVTAVEVDRHLLPALEESTEGLPVTIVAGDALALDWQQVLASHRRWALVANLPYNVGTPLILDLLADVPEIVQMLVMVQLEVAERLAAPPGAPACGIPSVKVAVRATAELVGRVPPTVFLPRPKVDSALVRIRRRPAPAIEGSLDVLFDLVETSFGQRRKMLRRSLADRVSKAVFEVAGVDPCARPEQLDLQSWGRLSAAVAASAAGQ